MPKTLVVIFAALGLVAVSVVGGAFWWWKYRAPAFFESTRQANVDARKVGAGMDEQACYKRSVTELKSEDGQSFGGTLRNIESLKGCLQASRLAPEFCTGVPGAMEILARATWEVDTCARIGGREEYCKHLLREVPTYCASPLRAAKLGKGG